MVLIALDTSEFEEKEQMLVNVAILALTFFEA